MQESMQWIEFKPIFPKGITDGEDIVSFQAIPQKGNIFISSNGSKFTVQEVIFNNTDHSNPLIEVILSNPT